MTTVGERARALANDRWLVFVVSMWMQCCAGVGYLFGSVSPLIKSSLGYNQREVALLGVAKNLGDCIGFVSGALCEIMPFWGILAIGVVHNFVGYGLLWLVVTHRLPSLPLWVLCIAIFIGTNGETYYNTGALVSCVQNFPQSRGQIVGILKGFSGLSGAILSQTYHIFSSSTQDSLILMIAVGPPVVILLLMFIVRSVNCEQQVSPSDGLSFTFIYGVCILLAAYLMGFLLLKEQIDSSQSLSILCSVILFIIVLLPVIVPIIRVFASNNVSRRVVEESLLNESSQQEKSEIIHTEVESDQFETIKGDRVREVKEEGGPRLGGNFTLLQTLVKVEFWLMFVSLVIGAGSGVTIIDNLGQICESLGYSDTRVFVSLVSVWNFLGRVGGGYFSELVVRKYCYPRPVAMAIVQVIMAIGLLYYAIGLPAAIYVMTVLVGFGYGAHWGIVPAVVSELFGLKSFGTLYNLFIFAMPIGSFIFSGGLASNIYDYFAKQQQQIIPGLELTIQIIGAGDDDEFLTCMGIICYSITCGILCGVLLFAVLLSLVVVYRTRSVYARLYTNS